MAPRRGISVSPGIAIDFSALARPAPTTARLLPRATTATSVWRVVLIIVLLVAALGLVFCVVVSILICKNKNARRKRQRAFEAMAPAKRDEYKAVQELNAGTGGVYELAHNNEMSGVEGGQRVELPTDGFVAAPEPSAQPAELYSEARSPDDRVHR